MTEYSPTKTGELIWENFKTALAENNEHNSLHLARKHASRIFLLLFLEVHSFPHVKLWENCLLLRTDDVCGQNILGISIFSHQTEANWMFICSHNYNHYMLWMHIVHYNSLFNFLIPISYIIFHYSLSFNWWFSTWCWRTLKLGHLEEN